MERARPGHTVEFQGLQAATHLNGTRGTLSDFRRNLGRWSVRCDGVDRKMVTAKPENLKLIAENTRTAESAMRSFPGMTGDSSGRSTWANGLSTADQYEWFSNCYQMRCDDDYTWGGGDLHGPYNPEASPDSIAHDLMVYCLLAKRCHAVPNDWDWPAFLRKAAEFVPYAFEKSDAKERWGGENVFAATMGGRSLRYTGEQIYVRSVQDPERSTQHIDAERDVNERERQVQNELGGASAWETFVSDLGRSRRFTGFG